MEDYPNFIRTIDYLFSIKKVDYAVALYMMSYIDEPSNYLYDAVTQCDINHLCDELSDIIKSMELYHINKVLGPESAGEYCNIHWNNEMPMSATEEYANNIYSIINLFKKNKITFDYFDSENLDKYSIHEDNMADPSEFKNYDSDDWYEYKQESQFEEIQHVLKKMLVQN